jgi:hypothetical protein
MKLAEAVNLRKNMRVKLASMNSLITQNLTHIEGDEPEEDVESLLSELNNLYDDYNRLIDAINNANNTFLPDIDSTLSQLIVKRDVLRQQAQAYRSMEGYAKTTPARMYGQATMPKLITVVKGSDIRKAAESFESAARSADLLIQRLDWVVDVQF